MPAYRFTQFGTFTVAVMLPVLVFVILMLFLTGVKDTTAAVILVFVALTLVVCLLIFYRLTIEIDDKYLTMKFGTGLFRKKYSLSEIAGCRPVRNPPIYGIGIRMIPQGWLFNVTGLQAIELSFKNRKSIVRIGTDRPEEVSRVVNRLVRHSGDYPELKKEKEYSGFILAVILLFVGLFMPAILIVAGSREHTATAGSQALEIKGIYGISLRYSDITAIDSVPNLPSIKRRTNGFAAGKTLKGNFTLSDGTRVKLFITKGTPPYINVQTSETNIWINFKDPERTRRLYGELVGSVN